MSLMIYALEACLGLLTVALVVQITRQYKTAELERSPSIAESHGATQLGHRDQSELEVSSSMTEGALFTSVGTPSTLPEVNQPTTGKEILDDYIGGFFADVAAVNPDPELRAIREDSDTDAIEVVESVSAEPMRVEPLDMVAPAVDLAAFKADTKSSRDNIPVLNTPIPEALITDRFVQQVQELDDEVITVEEEADSLSAAQVMSDKVVLAMLGEAKVVSAN